MEQRTLGSLVGQTTQTGTQHLDVTSPQFNTYLTLLSVIFNFRFSDTVDENNIEPTIVNSILKFCAICSTIALKTWVEIQNNTDVTSPIFQTYLKLFGIYLGTRFTDVSDLNTIDTNVVTNIARRYANCSTVIVQTWLELSSTQDRHRFRNQKLAA